MIPGDKGANHESHGIGSGAFCARPDTGRATGSARTFTEYSIPISGVPTDIAAGSGATAKPGLRRVEITAPPRVNTGSDCFT